MTLPFANLGPEIIAAFGETALVPVSRSAAGAYVNGRFVQPVASSFAIDAVVLPSGPKELEQLPENERTKESITVYSTTLLQSSDVSGQLPADVVSWAGRSWRVRLVEDYIVHANYMRAICVREGI